MPSNSTFNQNNNYASVASVYGFYDAPSDSLKLINDNLSSRNFNGFIPKNARQIDLYDVNEGKFNIEPGQYLEITDEYGQENFRIITQVRSDPEGSFYGSKTPTADESGTIDTSFSFKYPVGHARAGTPTDVFVDYMMPDGEAKTLTIVNTLDGANFPTTKVYAVRENWAGVVPGSKGWLVSSEGNAIFNNMHVRGRLEALSGDFVGNVTVNNKNMRIGSAVSTSVDPVTGSYENDGIFINNYNYWYDSGEFKVGDSDSTLSFDPDTSELLVTGKITAKTLNVGGANGIVYDGSSVTIGSDVTISADLTVNGLVVGQSPTLLKIDDNVSDINNLTTGTLVNDGLYVDRYNYWYSDGRFSVGNAVGTISFTTNPSEADTSLRVSDRLVVGTNASNNIQLVGGSTAANTFIRVGTGGYNTGTAKFYVDGDGKFSIAQKLRYTVADGLFVEGAINATSGTFLNTVNVGSATNTLKLTGTNTASTTAISSGTSTYKTGGIWMDASGRFSLGTDKLFFDGTDLTVTGNIVGGSFSIDANNFWNTAGHLGEFKVGDGTKGLYWNGTVLSVTGSITSGSGSIGGWTINPTSISSGNITLDSENDKIYIGTGTHANTNTGFYVDSTGKLSLSNQLIFNPANGYGQDDYAQLTIAGKIRGAIDSSTTISSNKIEVNLLQIDFNANGTATVDTDTNAFATGEYVVISGLTGSAIVGNGAFQITVIDNNTFTISGAWTIDQTFVSPVGAKVSLRELTMGLHPTEGTISDPFYHTSGIGVRLDKYNWWFTNNQFRVGTSDSYIKWNGTSLDVSGVINAKSGNFAGALTVNNGTMKIGTGVTTGKDGLRIDANNFWYSTGEFSVGGTNGITYTPGITGPDIVLGTDVKILGDITGASGSFSGNLVGGTIIGSTIRGSDVFANSAQIGGNAYGWIAGSGGLFSGTKESTSYLQSGFYSNEIIDIVQETQSGSSNIKRNLFIKTSKITSAQLEPDGITIKYISDNSFYKGEVINITGAADADYNGTNLVVEYALSGEFYVRRDRSGITPTSLSGMNATATSQTSVLGTMSGNSRSPYITFNNDIKSIEIGYELWIVTGSPTSWNASQFEYVGIVAEIVNSRLIKLRSTAPRIINNENFAISYVNSTVTMQFFGGLPAAGRKVSIETPGESEYAISGIFAKPDPTDDKVLTTKSIPPIFVAGTYLQKEFSGSPCFLSFSTGSNDNVQLNIKRIAALREENEIDPSSPFYNVKVYIDVADEDQVSVGDNILLSNMPLAYDLYYSLNSNYFPIIDITQETISGTTYAVLELYADGYLSFTTNPSPQAFTSYDISSYEVLNNTVTLTLSSNHVYSIGQVITIPTFDSRGYIDNRWTGEYVISDVPAANKISYQKVLPNSIDQTVPGDFDVIAYSYPLVQIYNNTKNYALWIGATSPDDAPFSVDTYGQNLKVKNIEVTGEVKGFYSDIIELDDFSGSFDGRNNAFEARYNQKELILDNPLRLVISLNGVVQSAFIQNREYVWQSGLVGFKGYTVDNGRIKFAESPPHGSTINARVFPGPQVNKKTRIYPFKAVDVALG
ncbi:hypothetical protein UFOVP359_71 [uncultured Caudovirales phage]|uniref:Uncharacterized protein n=1 Tax=uncultured Caudovirales phage TaxID=2100421 RepID=A0A6J7WYJ1_9CAUD|nr:hypothetical protein UFOVP359_71 [uncultured Caudovirales phage]